MNRRKTIKTLVGILAIVFFVLVMGLQVFLSQGLTGSLQNRVLPLIRARTGLDASVDRVSANPLAGSFTLHGVHIANPPGFEETDVFFLPRGSVTIGLLDMLKGGASGIRRVRASDGRLTVVRNSNGAFNVRELWRAFQRASVANQPAAATPSGDDGEASSSGRSGFRVNDFRAKLLARYVDHVLQPTAPVRLSVHLDVRLRNIVNQGPSDILSGAVSARGVMTGKDERGVIQMHGMVGPIDNPARLSFVASAKIEDLSVGFLRSLAAEQDLKLGWVSGSVNLQCAGGVFNPEKSGLRLTFHDTGFTGQMKEKMQGLEKLDRFTVIAPIGGTLTDPHVDVQGAIQQAMLSDEVLGAVLRHVMEHGGEAPRDPRGGDENQIISGKSFDLDKLMREIRRGPQKSAAP